MNRGSANSLKWPVEGLNYTWGLTKASGDTKIPSGEDPIQFGGVPIGCLNFDTGAEFNSSSQNVNVVTWGAPIYLPKNQHKYVQGVQVLSEKSDLLITPT